jgi:hypothetical protein
MFGKFREGFRSLRPHIRTTDTGSIVEIPVTTCPIVKLPIHMTYLLQLWQRSPRLTKIYLQSALSTCRLFGIGPSILLHPLDFLGSDDDPDLQFFPGMNVPRSEKTELLSDMLSRLMSHFQMGTMRQHAENVLSRSSTTSQKRATAPVQVAEPLIATAAKSV